MYGDKGRQQSVFRYDKLCCIGLVDIDGVKVEAPEIKLIAHLQRGQQILLNSRGILIVFNSRIFFLTAAIPAQQYSASKALARTEKNVA